eukprot:2113647-Pleurochrysis_carterae.AAC.1
MSTPQQRVYYQESVESVACGDFPSAIRVCNTCMGSLKSEMKTKGQARATHARSHAPPRTRERGAATAAHLPLKSA